MAQDRVPSPTALLSRIYNVTGCGCTEHLVPGSPHIGTALPCGLRSGKITSRLAAVRAGVRDFEDRTGAIFTGVFPCRLSLRVSLRINAKCGGVFRVLNLLTNKPKQTQTT